MYDENRFTLRKSFREDNTFLSLPPQHEFGGEVEKQSTLLAARSTLILRALYYNILKLKNSVGSQTLREWS